MITRRTIQFSFLIALSTVAIVLSFFIFKPYLNPLVLAGTFTVIFYPLYQKVLRGVGVTRRGLAAFIVVVVTVIIVLLPLTLVGVQAFREINEVYAEINENVATEQPPLGNLPEINAPVIDRFEDRLQGLVTTVTANVDQYIQKLVRLVVDNAGQFFQRLAEFAIAAFIWILAYYYFLRDGHRIRDLLIHFSPLSDRYDKEILHRVVVSVKTVIGGALIVALVQGVLAGLGLWIFGVPNPFIWGLVTVVTALIPTVGTAIVLVPSILYLFSQHQTTAAIGLLIWGVVIVGTIDNILRPKLIERGTNIHPLAVLLSVLGGIAFFGPVGFLTGPIILSLLIELLHVYRDMAVEQQTA